MPLFQKPVSLLVGSLGIAALLPVHGEGFRNPPAGGFSLGRAGGRYAQNDDPSTVVHNPANFVDFDSTRISVAPSFIYIGVEHEAGGVKTETTDPWKLLPNFFASMPLIDNKLALGFGLTTPYGLSNEWEQEGAFGPGGAFRYAAPWFTEMKTINANPALSYRINDQLSIGAGVNVHWSELVFKQFIPTGGPDASLKAKGDGFGFGGNAGITWEFRPGHRIAATYRSPVRLEYDGSTKTDFGNGNFETEVTFPTIVSLAYGVELTEDIRVEVSGEWLQFSNFKTLSIQTIAALGGTINIPQNWRNTFTLGFGGDWKFHENWTARAGYQYYKTPVPDSTFSPTIPDSNQNVITVGAQYHRGRHAIEGAYGYVFYDKRDINNGPAYPFNGSYEWNVHLFALSYNFSF
jgi:long-chain fatty acid transport protein